MTNELKQYISMMKQHGETEWEIGWESLPKYIGSVIHNKKTGIYATVCYEFVREYGHEGFVLKDSDENRVPISAHEFRHGEANWIYVVGGNRNV